ncbi:MAG: hypothetical protein ACOX5Q_04580 [Bacillota bacterium]|jgi:hypothetical protein
MSALIVCRVPEIKRALKKHMRQPALATIGDELGCVGFLEGVPCGVVEKDESTRGTSERYIVSIASDESIEDSSVTIRSNAETDWIQRMVSLWVADEEALGHKIRATLGAPLGTNECIRVEVLYRAESDAEMGFAITALVRLLAAKSEGVNK